MSGESTDQDTSKDVSASTKEDASKDASAKADASQEAGKSDTASKKPEEDVTGLKKALQATRKERDELLKAQRDAELAKLPELERFKAENDALAKENKELKLDNMRRRIAMEQGLPWNLAKRLAGDTEEDMRADAADIAGSYKPVEKQLIKEDPKNKRPTNDAKKSGSAGGPGMNDILRALAGRKAT